MVLLIEEFGERNVCELKCLVVVGQPAIWAPKTSQEFL